MPANQVLGAAYGGFSCMGLEPTATPARTASPTVLDFYVLFLDKKLPLAYSSAWVILRHVPKNANLLIGVFAFWISLRLNSFIRNTYETRCILRNSRAIGPSKLFRINI